MFSSNWDDTFVMNIHFVFPQQMAQCLLFFIIPFVNPKPPVCHSFLINICSVQDGISPCYQHSFSFFSPQSMVHSLLVNIDFAASKSICFISCSTLVDLTRSHVEPQEIHYPTILQLPLCIKLCCTFPHDESFNQPQNFGRKQ